ncbi:MAG: aminomethyl-transferring glycine dehydrogenase [Bacteroidota bacterium]|jgi:glycine dehydrogenase
MHPHFFEQRHIGLNEADVAEMLKTINAKTLDSLIDETIPSVIRLKNNLTISAPQTENEYLENLASIAKKNKVFKSYIGLGYYNTFVPNVIKRNVLENPGWYTAYTPYQAEIAQGRLEAILNFQTMVMDLTAMPIANASLLDEATAAAEAMIMFYANRTREQIKNNVNKFLVSEDCFPQTIQLLYTRSQPLGIELEVKKITQHELSDAYFGMLLQYPNVNGEVSSKKDLVQKAHEKNMQVVVASDLMALTLLVPPGEWGADVVVGNSQRFGVPMGYGGPHAAFFACKDDYKRLIPGRIIGVSVDAQGNHALRMALQTREQHIRRDKATSNICTAQALLAIMASMYAVYHGPEGLKQISTTIHRNAVTVKTALQNLGYSTSKESFFDTFFVQDLSPAQVQSIEEIALKNEINFRYQKDKVFISIDETTMQKDLVNIVNVFATAAGLQNSFNVESISTTPVNFSKDVSRESKFLAHPVFNSHHSETEMMRYIKSLENKDLSLTHSMISLGSCTMKLNAAAELYPITWREFAEIHPFVPVNQAEGYQEIFAQLDKDLSEITGFAKMSFQPNSGAQGEYAGLLVIREYHIQRGQPHRNIALIPSSAHGTNPASAAMAGMKIVVVKCDEKGNVDLQDLKLKVEEHKENLSCLMVTYPSTHGVFEEEIIEITNLIHANGGQVYMDGANMNAQVGLTSPGNIGADVCHLNLHKTFAIPHGGGGPGMGPIGVAAHLVDFLPSHPVVKTGGNKGITPVSAAPWGSSLILLISYGYIKMLGAQGVTNSTKIAILNANYIQEKLKGHYSTLYSGKNGRCAHEMILDCRNFKKTSQVEVADIAKRLMDYGFHAPTVSFPVADTLMVEPTESESKAELDKFIDAMISIRKEIAEIENGLYDVSNNVLKNAPHTAMVAMADEWEYPYSRKKAVYPINWLRTNKFWPSVGRVDNAYGDRNLVCSCLPIEAYADAEVTH